MSGWPRIYYKLLNLPLSVLVKSKSIPAEPAQELGLDTSRPIMYVLPYNSKADLLTLRAQCLAHDLPGGAAGGAPVRPKIGAVSSYHRSAAFLLVRCACGVLQPDKHLPKRSNLTTSLPAGFSRAKELLYGVRF